ncbi:MAG: hypothetical protein HQL22_11410, partial [Candidatus Omnitrophica bacterium]|nr:hypothetical protein [Candidatus Omnitrophota bacterium]
AFKIYSQDWGLTGEFYNGRNFELLIATGNAKTINFNDYKEMNPQIPAENFSARWQGALIVPNDGKYTFSILVDDGGRLFIDDLPVVEDWSVHPPTEYSKDISLSKGDHKIRIEYNNVMQGAVLKLYWTREGGHKQIIPAAYLRQKNDVIKP